MPTSILPPGSTLTFSNVELLITGTYQPKDTMGNPVGPPINFNTPTAISIWQTPVTQQTGQGITNYGVNGTGSNFGFGTAFTSANFSLTAPQPASGFGIAGLINTIPLDLTAAGVTSFTSAKIRGVLAGASNTLANPDFSAGLAIFTTNSPTNQKPNFIYGNAFNAVPGPLPIVGAGAAFGWSRRLRKRVRKVAATASVG